MVFRLAPESIRKMIAEKSNGLSESSPALAFVEAAPVSVLNFKFPGNVIPDFKFEEKKGMTIGAVFGSYTTENILTKAGENIRAGQFRLKRKVAAGIGARETGTFALGEAAFCLFIRECLLSEDDSTKRWAASMVESVSSQMSMTKADFEKMPINQLERRLAPASEIEEGEQTGPEKSHGAQGQTKKPGSHSESRHR